MKKENQRGILKMAAYDFKDMNYSSRIIETEDGNLELEVTRDFIKKVTKRYTVNDVIKMSLENDGYVFGAIIDELSLICRQKIKADFGTM